VSVHPPPQPRFDTILRLAALRTPSSPIPRVVHPALPQAESIPSAVFEPPGCDPVPFLGTGRRIDARGARCPSSGELACRPAAVFILVRPSGAVTPVRAHNGVRNRSDGALSLIAKPPSMKVFWAMALHGWHKRKFLKLHGWRTATATAARIVFVCMEMRAAMRVLGTTPCGKHTSWFDTTG
jgi:hypothetical protein